MLPFAVMFFVAFGLHPTEAKALWRSLQDCPQPQVKALVYLLRCLPPEPWNSLEKVATTYTPVRLAETLELAVPRYGNRRLMSIVQNQIAGESTRLGQWRLGPLASMTGEQARTAPQNH